MFQKRCPRNVRPTQRVEVQQDHSGMHSGAENSALPKGSAVVVRISPSSTNWQMPKSTR